MRTGFLFGAFLAALVLAQTPSPGLAQDGAASGELRIKLDQPLTADELGALSEALKRDAATDDAAPQEPAADWHVMLRGVIDGFGNAVAAIPQIPALFALLDERPPEWDIDEHGIELGHAMVLVMALGLLAEGAYRLAVRFIGGVPNRAPPAHYNARLSRALGRLAFDLSGVAIFAGLALTGVAIWLAPTGGARGAVLAVVVTFIVFRLHVAAALFALAPYRPELRLFAIEDGDARRMFLWFVGFAAFGDAVAGLINVWSFAGGGEDALAAFGVTFGLGIAIYKIAMIYAFKRPVAGAILHDAHSPNGMTTNAVRRAVARYWHLAFVAVAVGVYGGAALAITGGLGGALDDSQDSAAAAALTQNYAMLFPIILAIALAAFEQRARAAERANADVQIGMRHGALWRVAKKLTGGGVGILGLALIGGAWGLEWSSGPVGAFVGDIVDAAVVVLVFWIGWEILKAYIDPHIDEDDGPLLPGEDMGGAGATRLATILPLFRRFIFIGAVALGGLIALSNLGINIAPLLAGAGVVGLAIGFGAQTLVRDIISGIFFLIDDAFRKGEYIETGDIRGTVERISVRSLQLRHHNGPVHTIPFGEIAHLTNYSRDWAIMKFEVRVPFEVDVEKVRKLIKKAGQEMAQDPEWAEMLIEPLKSQGVNRMDDSAFIVRCKFTAKPGKQFQLRRVAYAWVQKAFAENGIPFAPKRVIVETVDGQKRDIPPPAMDDMRADALSEPPPTAASGAEDQKRDRPQSLVTAAAAGGAAVAAEQMAGGPGGATDAL